jgi:hypothetical protein
VHPLMWVFPFSFCALYVVLERFEKYWTSISAVAASVIVFSISPAPRLLRAYDAAAKLHANHYIQNWQWYELLGIIAPLVLFWLFARIARRRLWREIERVSRAFIFYGLIYLIMAMVLDLPARFEELARIQPLRSLHLLYIVMFVMIGGLLAEYVLQNQMWRWLLLFVPLSLGMFLSQRQLFPACAHVEWPGVAPSNPWEQAFLWVRQNTPVGAVFALDPNYMSIKGEDEIGFRCLAQRSRLADAVKDNGVVSMFPALAEEWWAQVQAQTPFNNFGPADFARLQSTYGVTWVLVQQSKINGLDCPYRNSAVVVCRLRPPPTSGK